MENTLLHKPITTIQEAKEYIDFLHNNDMLYHLDEDSRNIVDGITGIAFEDRFSDEILDAMDARNDEMSVLDWDKHEYCCEILGID